MTDKKVELSSVKRGKVRLYRSEDSYALLTYICDSTDALVVWNSTNREAPKTIDYNSKAYELDRILTSAHVPEYIPKVGEYIFIFVNSKLYKELKREECEKYWRLPFVRKKYKSIEELISFSCRGMKKEQLYLFKVTKEWLDEET